MSDIPRIGVAAIEPEQEVIDALEDMLAQARSGELRGFVHVSVLNGKEISYGFYGAEIKGGYMRTCGYLTWLAHQAMLQWDERLEESPRASE